MAKDKNRDEEVPTKKSKNSKRGKSAAEQKQPAHDSEPQKKKKKITPEVTEKVLGEEELTPEEKRILERKLKKERKKEEKMLKRKSGTIAIKEETKTPSGAELALEYLTSWSNNRAEWKFQKTRQTWLLHHMYDSDKVPDEYFPVLLEYLEGLKGHARDTTVQKAEALMKEHEKCEDSVPLEKVQRARETLQLLS